MWDDETGDEEWDEEQEEEFWFAWAWENVLDQATKDFMWTMRDTSTPFLDYLSRHQEPAP